MKTTSNSTFSLAATVSSLLTLGIMVIAPATSLALDRPASRDAKVAATAKTSEFCTKLPSEASEVNSKLNKLVSTAGQNWSDKSQNWTSVWQNVDSKVAAERSKADAARQQDFTKLEARAKTNSEQQAVKTFEAAVDSSVNARRTAYDNARQTFRSGVDAAISGRQSAVTGQLTTFETAVNTAIQTAESSCASTPGNGPAIRTAFVSSLRTARESFEGDRKNDATISSQVKQLAVTRDAAFKAADQVFQSSMESARQALKQAFGSSGSSV